MNRFSYVRARQAWTRPSRALAAEPPAKVHRRRHQPDRPDEVQRRAADAAGRHHPDLPPRADRGDRGGGLRIGALVTNDDVAYDRSVEERYPLLSSAILAGASPQLRNMATTGGNLHAAHPLLLFLRHRARPATSASPGTGCPRHRRRQPQPRHPGHERALHRDASVGHVRGAGRAGGGRACGRAGRRARHPDRRVPPPAGRPAGARHHPAAGRDHHGGRAAAGAGVPPRTTPT